MILGPLPSPAASSAPEESAAPLTPAAHHSRLTAAKPKAPLTPGTLMTPRAHTTPAIFLTCKTPAAPETPVIPGEPGHLQQNLRGYVLWLLPPNWVRHHWNLFPSQAVRVPNHFLCPDQKKQQLAGRIMKFYYESLLLAACWKQAQNYNSPSNNPCMTNCNKRSDLPSCLGPHKVDYGIQIQNTMAS